MYVAVRMETKGSCAEEELRSWKVERKSEGEGGVEFSA